MNLTGFREQRTLGKGTYGEVYKAIRESDGKSYAVKVVDLSKLNQREISDAVNEIRLMASFTSPFILGFFEAFCEQKRLCIVTEYAQLGDLSSLIARRKRKRLPLPETFIWRFLLQLLSGLKVLHSCGVVHRDLKSANILLSAPDLLKIGDLGISTVLRTCQLARTQIGTPLYLAPEVWRRYPYDQKCDMWSLGVLLYEMMTFQFPFSGRTTDQLALQVCRGNYSAPSDYSADLKGIVQRLLKVNPRDRASCDDILELPCVQSRMDMLVPFMQLETQSARLLSTIKVPMTGVARVSLPESLYGKRKVVVKPLDQRMHVKRGVNVGRREISELSTPEMTRISDQDLWSPTKPGMFDNPLSHRPSWQVLETNGPRLAALDQEMARPEPVAPLKRKALDPTRKINFVPSNFPAGNLQYRPVLEPKGAQRGENMQQEFADPRWKPKAANAGGDLPVCQPPVCQLPWMMEPRKNPMVGINPRFRRRIQ